MFKYINPEIFAAYAKAKQAYLEDIARDEKEKAQQLAGSSTTTNEEQLLTAAQAAEMLACSKDWLYRNSSQLPFTCKLGGRNLRFSKQKILKWLETRRATH